jgi:hypothetical protein
VILIGLIATASLLAPAGVDAPAAGDVPLFLDDVSGGRAPAACVKAALPRLRDQLARDGRVRLVETREEATLVVDVRECGSRWETKTGGEVGVGVTVGGGGPPRTASGSGSATQVGVGVRRQLSGYVVLRARSTDRAPEFTSLPHTELFAEAVSVTSAQLLDWVGEHARELQPR